MVEEFLPPQQTQKGYWMLRKLKSKDKLNFEYFLTTNNLSIYLFSDFIKNKKLAFVSDEKNEINGLIFVNKQDNDFYLNIITESNKVANNLLKIFFWNWKKSIFAQINVKNKIGFILKSNGFKIVSRSDDVFILSYNPNFKFRKRKSI